MVDVALFRAELRRFVEQGASKAAAARALGISRQDLYRYLRGATTPRSGRLRTLLTAMQPQGQAAEAAEVARSAILSMDRVADLRDVLLHLVSLVELDLAVRQGDERKGG